MNRPMVKYVTERKVRAVLRSLIELANPEQVDIKLFPLAPDQSNFRSTTRDENALLCRYFDALPDNAPTIAGENPSVFYIPAAFTGAGALSCFRVVVRGSAKDALLRLK